MTRAIAVWNQFWFRPVPPHLYALLRIVWGLLALVGLAGVADLTAFWHLDGLVAPIPSREQTLLLKLATDTTLAPWMLGVSALIYAMMTVGLWSAMTVPLAFITALVETEWNRLPLSAAFQAHIVLLFCLIWTDCGEVWSVDAWWRRRTDTAPRPASIWPLRLFRFQVALIYFASGFWKFQDVHWRDGSALHYVLSNTQFRRFPLEPSVGVDLMLTLGTYATLLWELAFPLLILNRITRRLALGLGVLIHTGMWLTLELGPFSGVMIGSYLAFMDPDWFAARVTRLQERWARRPRTTEAPP